jgi:signal transduction histidine kinase
MNDLNEVYHVIEIRKNITDEKKMVEYMVRSEKLASIGKMTGGIAHEMNNPLSGISGNAVNLLAMPEKYGLNEKGVIRITEIQNLATRAMATMTSLLQLSQRPEQLFILTDINDLLIKTIHSLHLGSSQDTTPTFQFGNDLPLLYCDPLKMQQVMIHLTNNALQAIQEKKLTLAEGQNFNGSLIITTQHKDNHVVITFTDNGIGIAEDIRTKIFDPFFSTKPTGQGTGLGLSVSNKIIEEHRGKIFFECTNGLTIFTLLIPLQQSSIT